MAELVHVQGLKELSQALKALPENIARNVLRGAVNAGARLVREEARQKAPVMQEAVPNHQPPGTLKRSIVSTFVRELSNLQQVTYFVAVRQGKRYRHQGKAGTLSQDAYYWRFVEFGTSKMSARPFMRSAFEAKKQEAVQAMAEYLAKRIPDEVAKLPGAKR